MFLLRRPSRRRIERFLRDSQTLSLSYGPIGLARETVAGRAVDIDEAVVAIGRGRADFGRAKAALASWREFELGWVELFPRDADLEAGSVVAILVRHFGCWSLNGCRVVYTFGEVNRDSTFGFAYGTLTNHAESGEELFEVSLNPESDDVLYRIRAVSKPRAAVARLGYPLTRSLQARFRRESAEAMKRATSAA